MSIKAMSKAVFDMDLKCPYCDYDTWYDLSSGNFIGVIIVTILFMLS